MLNRAILMGRLSAALLHEEGVWKQWELQQCAETVDWRG